MTIRLTLVAGDTVVELGQDGVGLTEWPGFLDGLRRSHVWDTEAGLYRREVPAGVTELELPLRVRGRDAGDHARQLMEAIHAAEELELVVESRRGGTRRLVFQLVEFGEVAWNPHPDVANLVDLPLRGETVYGAFTGEEMVYTTTATGRVVVPYAGDVEAWPTLAVSAGGRFKLRERDEWQAGPAGSVYTAYTDPAQRRIEVGGVRAPGLVAFWPLPPRRVPGGVELWLDRTTEVTVTMTERWRAGWA